MLRARAEAKPIWSRISAIPQVEMVAGERGLVDWLMTPQSQSYTSLRVEEGNQWL